MPQKPIQPKISLDQWAALRAVVEEGSFAKAAERLNKNQSSVSYSLGLLNQQLPVAALQLSGRKAELTAAGQVFYRQACQLLDAAMALEEGASRLAQGWEAEVTLALDALVPLQPVLEACCVLARENPLPVYVCWRLVCRAPMRHCCRASARSPLCLGFRLAFGQSRWG